MRKVSFVIPCYGSEKTLENVVNEVIEVIGEKKEYDYEIILVNDYSPDKVWSVIEKLCIANKRIIGICLASNFGQHAALMAGYSACKGEIIVSLDDDGQTPANEVFSLIDKLGEGYDVVYGAYKKKKHSSFRNFGSRVNEKMMESLVNKPRGIKATSYFVAKDYIISEVLRYKNSYPYVGGLIFRATKNIANVYVEHKERQEGKSGYSLRKLLSLWFNGFTAFSVKPLRVATIIGIMFALLGFLYAIYTIFNKIFNPEIQAGWSSIIASIFIVGGLILFVLGLIGEYVGRIYISINAAPQYVVKKKLNIINEESYE